MGSSTNSKPSTSFDDEQQKAIEAEDRAIVVLAGPGSGKTRTLSLRTRYLLSANPATSALLLTFTNKAAAEMKARVLDGIGLPKFSTRLAASTFHTFCADVLRSHGEHVGLGLGFDILEDSDAKAIANLVCSALSLPSGLINAWSDFRLRQQAVPPLVEKFGLAYQEEKRRQGVVDFNDLVVYVADIFRNQPEVAEAYAGRYPHILVDEFQDTNAVQLEFLKSLFTHAMTISVFADDDQAIFGFAGAQARNIMTFVKDTEATVYPLTTNYRSGGAIVDIANRLIQSSATSSKRRMTAHRPGGSVQAMAFDDEFQEARWVSAGIADAITMAERPSDFAVLVRSAWRADKVVKTLEACGVPLSDWRTETYPSPDRRAFATCLSVVRGHLNERQTAALCSLMNVPKVDPLPTDEFLSVHKGVPLADGLVAVRDLLFEGAKASQIARATQKALARQDPALGNRAGRIVDSVLQFEAYDPDFGLEHLLTELALGSIGRSPTVGGGVKIATLHRAKGLQWKTVYLVGLEEGTLPEHRATTSERLEEELRLCFVGVSRAEEALHVTWCRRVGAHGKQASRFLDCIDGR